MEETTAPSVRSIGIKFGLISGAISIAFFLILTLTGFNPFGNVWGWVRLAISVAILVLAHKAFKDEGDGFMSFGQGFGIGFWMTIVGLILGMAFTYVYINYVSSAPLDLFYQEQMEGMQEKNMADDQIEMAVGWTKKLFWPIAIVFGMIFGLIMALAVTIFTQKRNPQAEIA